MGSKIKHGYSTSLLSLATRQRQINASPLAFGEGNIKGRIKNILNFKKPATWVIAVSILLVAVLIIGFTTNRPTVDGSTDLETYELSDNYKEHDLTINAHNLTINDVRTLAKKGNELKFQDFNDFTGADVSSNTSYRIMVYHVEGGYRLIVRTDGNQIDIATLQGIWDSGDIGIDIRYNNVDEFIKSHPSSENLTNWQGIMGMSRDEVHKKMGNPDGMLSGFYGDTYKLDDDLNLIIYYNEESKVFRIEIAVLQADTSPQASLTPTDGSVTQNEASELMPGGLPKVFYTIRSAGFCISANQSLRGKVHFTDGSSELGWLGGDNCTGITMDYGPKHPV